MNIKKAKSIIGKTIAFTTLIGGFVGFVSWMIVSSNRDESVLEQKFCAPDKMVHHSIRGESTKGYVVCEKPDGTLVLHITP